MLSCDCHVTLTSTCLQTDPLDRYLKKYSLASRRTISSADIARYGRQILEVLSRSLHTCSYWPHQHAGFCESEFVLLLQALQFLNEKGFVLGEFEE